MNATQNQTFSILFWVNKARINKARELPVYAWVTVDGKRAEASLQRSVPESLWNQEAPSIKGKGENPRVLNTYLDLTVANIQKIYNHLLSTDKHKPLSCFPIPQPYAHKKAAFVTTCKSITHFANSRSHTSKCVIHLSLPSLTIRISDLHANFKIVVPQPIYYMI